MNYILIPLSDSSLDVTPVLISLECGSKELMLMEKIWQKTLSFHIITDWDNRASSSTEKQEKN